MVELSWWSAVGWEEGSPKDLTKVVVVVLDKGLTEVWTHRQRIWQRSFGVDRGLNTSSEEKASSYTDIQTHSALYTTTWVLPLLSHTAVRTQNTLYDTLWRSGRKGIGFNLLSLRQLGSWVNHALWRPRALFENFDRDAQPWVLCTYRTHDDGHEKLAGRELRLLWCSRQLFGRRSPSIIDGHIHTVFKVVSYRVLDARWLSWTESKTSSRHLSKSVGSSMWSWLGGYHHRWTQHRCSSTTWLVSSLSLKHGTDNQKWSFNWNIGSLVGSIGQQVKALRRSSWTQ